MVSTKALINSNFEGISQSQSNKSEAKSTMFDYQTKAIIAVLTHIKSSKSGIVMK